MDASIKQLAETHLGKGMRHAVWGELNLLRKAVPESELIRNLFTATVAPHGKGLLILTDHRLIYTKAQRGSLQTIELTLSEVTQVEVLRSWRGADVMVAGAGVFLDAKELYPPARVDELESNIRAYRTRLSHAIQPAANLDELLRNLAALRDDGILSEQEFAAKKADILARM